MHIRRPTPCARSGVTWQLRQQRTSCTRAGRSPPDSVSIAGSFLAVRGNRARKFAQAASSLTWSWRPNASQAVLTPELHYVLQLLGDASDLQCFYAALRSPAGGGTTCTRVSGRSPYCSSVAGQFHFTLPSPIVAVQLGSALNLFNPTQTHGHSTCTPTPSTYSPPSSWCSASAASKSRLVRVSRLIEV